MIERDRKKVYLIYFKSDGDMYRMEEEYIVGEYTERGVINESLKRQRFSNVDLAIIDGGDNVIPYITPFLKKNDKKRSKSKGF